MIALPAVGFQAYLPVPSPFRAQDFVDRDDKCMICQLTQDKHMCEKTYFQQGHASTILLTQPSLEEIHQSTKIVEQSLDRSDTGDHQRDIKKEGESQPHESCELSKTESKSPSKPKKTPKPSKSFNHNFQKHAVITIKKLGKRMCQNFGNSPAEVVATQMWNVFQSCGICSKKILVVLFGLANMSSDKSKELFKSCYFGEVCSYDEATIRAAQNLLRERLLELTSAELIRSHIFRSRKINQRDQFIAYFNEFIELLKEGPLTKFRLNAESTHHIEQKIKETNEQKASIKKEEAEDSVQL